ncbi:MAG: TetR/AcrR family transcriptional regulator [Actinobacteria bacterium]|nr:TetR/AcrR family transcriptional regulator [Actinomycetota bacterium]
MGKVEVRRARVVDAILAAAAEVMSEGGAASLSLGEVARRMGMRTPSLYGYFGSRAELCDEIFRRGWLEYGRISASIEVTPDGELGEELCQGLYDSVSWANEHRAAAELMFWRPIPHWEPSPAAYGAAAEVVSTTRGLVGKAQSFGLLRADADAEEMTEVLGVLFTGVISQQLSNEPGVEARSGRTSRYASALADMFMHRYGTEVRSTP